MIKMPYTGMPKDNTIRKHKWILGQKLTSIPEDMCRRGQIIWWKNYTVIINCIRRTKMVLCISWETYVT